MPFSRHRLRGDAPQLNSPVLDRRHSPRREVLTPEASLSWERASAQHTVAARLVNLSRGGAGLLVRETPPGDAELRLFLSGGGGGVVEGRAVGTRPDDQHEGWTFLHVQFARPCPDRILRGMLGGAAEGE